MIACPITAPDVPAVYEIVASWRAVASLPEGNALPGPSLTETAQFTIG